MAKKKTHEEFVEEIFNLNSNIKVLGEYKTTQTKIECKCLVCENVWYVKPNKLLSGRGCPICGEKRCRISKRMKHEDFEKKGKRSESFC